MTRSSPKSGWLIVAVSTLALIISNGLAIGGLPPFYKPVREEFVALGAISPTAAESFIANAANITFLMSGVFSLLGGWLLTRINMRLLMVIGCCLLGGGLLLHARAESVEAVYGARFLMGASLGFVGVAPNVVLVSRWFSVRRGTALGIVLTGTSLGGFLLAPLAARLIGAYGWRTAMVLVSLLVWLLLLPAMILLVREPPATAGSSEVSPADGMTLREAVRTRVYWIFALTAALVFYPIFVTTQQFILYLQTPRIGMSAELAAFAQSGIFGVSLGGKFLAGYVSDRLDAKRVIVLCSLVMFLATLVLFALTASNALLFLLPFGLGYGGTFVLLQRLAADLFGRREAGKILGSITLIEVAGAAVGGRVTGYLADQAGGDYTYAFYGVSLAAALAFVSTILLYATTAAKPRRG